MKSHANNLEANTMDGEIQCIGTVSKDTNGGLVGNWDGGSYTWPN